MTVRSALRPSRAIVNANLASMLETLDVYIRSSTRGRFGGKRVVKSYGSSLEWTDYREYAQGDDLRRIDWSLAARFDKYYVKNYLDERQLSAHIYIDTSASMACSDEKALMAARLAAAFGYLSVANMDRASFRLLNGRDCRDISGDICGKDAFFRAAGCLSRIEFAGSVNLKEAIFRDMSPGYADGLSFIISDFLTDSDWKSAVDYLLNRRREVVLVQVLDVFEQEPDINGLVELFDAESGISASEGMKLDIDRGAIIAYRQAFEDWQRDMDAFCAKRSIPVIHAKGDDDIARVILEKAVSAGVIK